MKYGLDVATTGDFADPFLLVEMAKNAEQAGWDGFFIWDVIFDQERQNRPVIDPWVALSAIAARTERIRIGAMVTPLARRRPWVVARTTASLDHLSRGRLIFGAGLGYQDMEFTPFGEETDPRHRAEKLDEGLDVLAGLWQGSSYAFHGEHFQVDVEGFLPIPVQHPRIPVWVAGYWPNKRPFRRAAHWDGTYIGAVRGDGEPARLEDVKDAIAYVKEQNPKPSFDFAFSSAVPLELGASYVNDVVRPFAEAGVTWWMEGINEWAGSMDELRERIQGGPPRV